MFGRLLICIGALVTLGSCSADKAASSSKVTLDLGTVVAETSPVTAASSEPDPTAVSVVATLPTIAPSTTELTTTTTIDPKAEVAAAYLAALEVRHACNYEPESCDFDAIAVAGSPQDVQSRRVIAERIKYNLRSVLGIGTNTTEIESTVVGGEIAFVNVCALDGGVLFDVGDPSNPADDIVFDDSTVSLRVRWEMRQVNGIWLMFEGIESERLSGGDLCGF